MKAKLFKTLAATMAMVACMGTTVCAAPKQMADGVMFDPQYYAQSNPDVVAAIGSDENILYKHYALYGKAEGRAALAPSQPVATPLPAQGEVIAWASDPGDKTVSITGKSGKVYTYSLPTLKGRWEKYGYKDENLSSDDNWEIYDRANRDYVHTAGKYNEACMMEVVRAAITQDVSRITDVFDLYSNANFNQSYTPEMQQEEWDIFVREIQAFRSKGAPAGDFRIIEVAASSPVNEGIVNSYTVYDSNWGKISIGVETSTVDSKTPVITYIGIGEW